jgi:multiple sugar transport system substrate-binding protein
MTGEELLSLLDLVERMRLSGERRLGLLEPDAVWNMTVFLMRRHLTGRLVTPTSLARAAEVPYTTALRRIEEMFQAGLLVRRPRTRSGLSHSIHPSALLVDRVFAHGREIKAAIAQALGGREDPGSFYLGTSYLSARIIPPPAVPESGLGPGQSLGILLYNDPVFFVGEALRHEIAHLLGGPVRFEGRVLDELRERALANAALPRSEFDILAVDLPWMGEYAQKGVLLPLDELVAASGLNRADFYPASWAAGRAGGRQHGIPIQTTAEVLIYRRDMLEARGLEPPATTDELLAVARALHAPGEGIYGVSWAGAQGLPVGYAFMLFLADFGQPLLSLRRVPDGWDPSPVAGDELRPRIDTGPARLAAEFMRELLEVSPPDVLETSWIEQIELVSRGNAALAYIWAIRAARFERDPASPARGNVGFLPHPLGGPLREGERRGNVSAIGGFVLAIPANLEPARVPLAWRAIEWLTSPEVMKLFVQHGGLCTPRFSVAADVEVRRIAPVIAAIDAMAKEGQLRLWPRPPVPEFAAIATILGEEIHAMLRRTRTIPTALRHAQSRIDRLMRANGRY